VEEFKNGYLVSNNFLEKFNFPLIKGSIESVFADPKSIVITEELATEIFGNENPIGRTIRFEDVLDLTVTGILENLPSNSHLQFSCLIPEKGNIDEFYATNNRHWGMLNFYTYLHLRPDANIGEVKQKLIAQIPQKQVKESATYKSRTIFSLIPILDIYLHEGEVNWDMDRKGDWKTLKIVSLIGLLILIIACINYVNLSTARSSLRAKATGVRKVIGASKMQLFGQFMTETALLVGVASLFAVMLTQICLPIFEEFSGKNFSTAQVYSWQTVFIILATVFVTILLTGVQPAIQLSSFQPAKVLRGNSFSGTTGRGGLRKVLVVGQFVCSAALIMATIVILNQLDYVRKSKLGYEKEHIFTIYTGNEKLPILKAELEKNTAVIDITASDHHIYDVGMRIGGTKWEGKKDDNPWTSWAFTVNENYNDFFGLEMTDGRWFLPGNRDSMSFMINETAAKEMKLKSPVGKWIEYNEVRGVIAGVLKDFHFRPLHEPIEPLILANWSGSFRKLQVKTTGENAAAAIVAAETLFKEHLPNQVFQYNFVDEAYDKLYTNEAKTAQLFTLFSGLAILISCLGIFGLAAFTAQRRNKEIGVRKVLGASLNSIVLLLSKDFLKLIGLALIIAVPIAWVSMNDWLQNFAYRIDIEWWVFVTTGILLGAIAFLTVSYQSVRAALMNPVESLKSE